VDAERFDDITVNDVLRHFLRREVRAFAVHEALVRRDFDVEAVHQLRVSARRLRSEIQAMRSVLPAEPWDALARDLKRVGAALGPLRDLDVLAEIFAQHLDAGTQLDAALRLALGRQRVRRERVALAMLDAPLYAKVVRRVGALSETPGLGRRGDASARDLFAATLWEAACAYLDAVREPAARRSDEELHRVRIASKKCRYSFEVATVFLGDQAHRVAQPLAEIQGILGDVHDRAVAVSFLDTLRLPEELDLELRRTLRNEIAELRPSWARHYDEARQAMLALFESPPSRGV